MSFENAGLETGLDIDENIQICKWLVEDGINYVHISHMFYDARSVKYPDKIALQYIHQQLNNETPLICPGSIRSAEDAEKALNLGASIVAIGRASVGNDKLPEHFLKGESLPFQTPYSENTLLKLGVSQDFMGYIKNSIPLSSLNIIKRSVAKGLGLRLAARAPIAGAGLGIEDIGELLGYRGLGHDDYVMDEGRRATAGSPPTLSSFA